MLRKEIDYNTGGCAIDFLIGMFNSGDYFINGEYQR